MSYQMVLKGGVTGTKTTATFIGVGGDTIVLSGTGFQYDADGYLKSGSVASMTYMSSDFAGTEKAQVVTMKNVSAADLYDDLLSPAIGLIKKTSDWSHTDEITSFSSKTLVLEMDDFTQVIVRGTGFVGDPTKGKVTSLQHLDVNGHNLEKITNLNVSLSVALTALGESTDIYNYLTRGDNTITNLSNFPPHLEGGLGNDTLKGGKAVFAVADYMHTAIAGIKADLGTGKVTGGAGTDKLIDIFSLNGSNFNDVIIGKNTKAGTFGDSLSGEAGNDRIDGLGGNDFLSGGVGNDTLNGGSGDDSINGEAGNDRLDGGAGNDIVSFSGRLLSLKGVTISLLATGTQDFGAWGKDTVTNVEGVYGSDAGDHITGNKADNTLVGGGGTDYIRGLEGNDTLYAQVGPGGVYSNVIGNDTLDGGAGNDVIYTGDGADVMIGGSGKDTFVFSRPPATYYNDLDRIKDFASKDDTIKISSFQFDQLDPGKVGKTHFVLGTAAKDGDDWLIYDKHSGNLYYDDDGKDGHDQVLITTLINKTELTYADFLVT